VGDNEIGDDKNERQISGNFDCHGDAAVQRGAHRPIEHIKGFTGSQGLHLEPLDAAIRQVPALYCPCGRHGQRIC